MDNSAIGLAFSGTVEGIEKGIRLLRSIAHSADEFCDLLNELETLNVFLKQTRQTIDDLSQSQGVPAASIDGIARLQLDLSQTVNELNLLAKSLASTSSGLKSDGRQRISPQRWQREKQSVVALRDRSRICRENMASFCAALGPSQIARNNQLVLQIHEVHSQSASANEQFAAAAVTMIERLDILERRLPGMIRPAAPRANAVRHGARQTSAPSPQSVVSLRASVRRGCDPACRCQCHHHSTVKTPAWLRSAVGAFTIQYNAIPVFDRRPCDMPRTCRSGDSRSFHLQYMLPSWLLPRMLCLAASWGSLTDTGSGLFLKVPRAIYLGYALLSLTTGDLDWLRYAVVEKRILPTDIDISDGEPLLLFCLRKSHLQAVRLLLDEGFDVNLKDSNGLSTSSYAASILIQGPGKKLPANKRAVLERVVEIAEEDHYDSPSLIHQAILGTCSLTLQDALASEPQKINSLDRFGRSPLHWAVLRSDEPAVRVLVSHGTDLELREEQEGCTALMLACREENLSIMTMLVQAGAETNVHSYAGASPISHALHAESSEMMLPLLLGHGADPNLRNERGYTPLIRWCGRPAEQSRESCLEIVSLLVKAGADLEAVDDRALWTPLLMTIWNGKPNIAWALYRCGAQVNAVNTDQQTLLHLTALYVRLEMMELLRLELDLPLDPDALDTWQYSPLDILCMRMRLFRPNKVWTPPTTQMEVFVFSALIVEMREKNWAEGRFLESKARLAKKHQDLKRWLGRQAYLLRYYEWFGSILWDHSRHYYYDQIDFDHHDDWVDNLDPGLGLLLDEEEENGDEAEPEEEEFFDALEA